jgi:hypothetical protein
VGSLLIGVPLSNVKETSIRTQGAKLWRNTTLESNMSLGGMMRKVLPSLLLVVLLICACARTTIKPVEYNDSKTKGLRVYDPLPLLVVTCQNAQLVSVQDFTRRAGRCWGKPQNSDKMTCPIHWPLEPGEAPVCASNCNSSSVTMTVTQKPSPMSSPSTSITNASNISG